MNNDNELFELCKEVYELFPEWTDTNADLWHTIDGKIQPLFINQEQRADMFYSPYYTSDYLLEKLPLGENVNMFFYRSKGGIWLFQWTGRNVSGSGDTPLKALLKLTIALHDAGQLNNQ